MRIAQSLERVARDRSFQVLIEYFINESRGVNAIEMLKF